MISLISSFAVLIIGYLVYGRFAERVFGPDERQTPAIALNDGVDCVPLKRWKSFLIQLLNIAGTGPIFGALMGAVFGPIVFLWIILGSVFAGALHDYMSGMISCRHGGASLAEFFGIYMGNGIKWAMRIFTILLMILVGTVFITSPATLLANLTPDSMSVVTWEIIIVIYYILATLLPIDKLIGKLYPVFGAALMIMAFGIAGVLLFSNNYTIPEITLSSLHPTDLPAWPFMFITVACGAISGFHATQSPMIAKCITSEKQGRSIFYGAMIAESIIALVWASAGVAFYSSTNELNNALGTLGQSGVVYEIATTMLGSLGGLLAIIGVVVCPITSGDTAFRSARLIIAECTNFEQKKFINRLIITIPLLVISIILTRVDFNILWRYFSWSNQTLAMVTLWCITAYFIKHGKYRFTSLISAVPAAFMSAVSLTYILMADEGFKINSGTAYPLGVAFALGCFAFYLFKLFRHKKQSA